MEDHNKHHHHFSDAHRDENPEEPKTTHEIIREAYGDPELDLTELKDELNEDETSTGDVPDLRNTGTTAGVGYDPNDASAVRSGGFVDMDDQAAGGAGLNTGNLGEGLRSSIATKRDVTGSDYDGQNSTSNP